MNENEDYQEWMISISHEAEFSPVCWNGYPSSKFFGASPVKLKSESTDSRSGRATRNNAAKSSDNSAWWLYTTIIAILSVILVVLVYILFSRNKQLSQ